MHRLTWFLSFAAVGFFYASVSQARWDEGVHAARADRAILSSPPASSAKPARGHFKLPPVLAGVSLPLGLPDNFGIEVSSDETLIGDCLFSGFVLTLLFLIAGYLALRWLRRVRLYVHRQGMAFRGTSILS